MPRKIKPRTSINALMIISSSDWLKKGMSGSRMIERPLTPPVAKWLGDLKKYTPAASAKVPTLSTAQYLT